MATKVITVWYDDASDDEPRWIVSLEDEDGAEAAMYSLHRTKAAALKAGRIKARKLGLALTIRTEWGETREVCSAE